MPAVAYASSTSILNALTDYRTGESLTHIQKITSVYYDDLHNPISLKLERDWETATPPFHQAFQIRLMFNHNLRKALGLQKCWLHLKVWTTLTTAGPTSVLSRFRFHIMYYLNSLGVISIKDVIDALHYVIDKCIWIDQMYVINGNIQFKIY
nr:C3 [Soybean yellow leaf curl virus]WIF18908.1 C3 [Soybean stay-green associated virus]